MNDASVLINEYLDVLFSYGTIWVYLAVTAACFLENLFPPFPGDTFIVAAGALVGLDRLDILGAGLSVIGGGLASVMIVYFVGLRYGRDFFIRRNSKYFSTADIMFVERQFGKWGGLILIVSRFVVGIRTVLSLVAGISRYPASKMLVFSLISYLIFAGLIFYLSGKLVENLDLVEQYIRTYSYVAWALVIGLIVAYVLVRIKKTRGESAQ